ncbi:hypothetical protein [Engelhardtia mirabilis]|uniref:SGNH hydrolase-type esterase domain-containing protein n=1 Tax=Engelhardtia mirabilis TaxID=2528011 RepID=A0A518BGP1_9BACT|nr:hypothetical protein Pla133_12240 [Planctomycetes bacterium Pla133]QDV00485.1 hypothetical protein Pla86_12240 [Planctomycetes bacterium Pla86]
MARAPIPQAQRRSTPSATTAGTALAVGPRTISFVGLLLLAEFALRHLGGYGLQTLFENSPRYSWQLIPHQARLGQTLRVREYVNGQGFRDGRDWSELLAPDGGAGPLRVAVLGNSLTYGTGVEVEQTWPRVLEAALDGALGPGRDAVVMNFAVAGYTFEQMARVFDDQVAPGQPALVLWPVTARDMGLMAPTRELADYPLRRLVVRTAIHDMLLDSLLRNRIADIRSEPEPGADGVRRGFWVALLDATSAVIADELEAGVQAAAIAQLKAAVGVACAGAPETDVPGILVSVFERFARDWAPDDARGLLLSLWSAFESSTPAEVWDFMHHDFIQDPHAARHAGLRRIRGARLAEIVERVEGWGGGLVVIGLPTTDQLVSEAPGPTAYWRDEWLPALASDGASARVVDAAAAFDAPMAELAAAIRERGYVRAGEIERVTADYAGSGSTLVQLDDPWHYNADGHRLVAAAVARVVGPLLDLELPTTDGEATTARTAD